MMVRVKLFAVARQLAGRDVVEVELPEPATIGQLARDACGASTRAGRLSRHVMFAVGTEYADDDARSPGRRRLPAFRRSVGVE